MKPRVIVTALCALTIVAVFAAAVVSRRAGVEEIIPPGAKTFQVHGQVREVNVAGHTVRITHEEIPNYMPAMTMPFTVKRMSLLKGIKPGDQVTFELVVTDDDSWISRLSTRNSGTAPGQSPTAEASADREAQRVQSGEIVPDFELVDQDGKTFHLADFKGKAVVMTFIYTRCPIPNFCPLMSKNFMALQEKLSKEFGDKYRLLSVSIDPKFDHPEILKQYAARYDADETRWRFATGTEEQVNFVASLMGLFHEPENGWISHDLRTALISPDGRLVHLWKSNAWTPYEVQRMVREVLGSKENVASR